VGECQLNTFAGRMGSYNLTYEALAMVLPFTKISRTELRQCWQELWVPAATACSSTCVSLASYQRFILLSQQ